VNFCRVFISIDIPEEIRKEIIKIQNNFPEFIGKKTESENLHLTLKFLGEISEDKLKEIKKRLEKINFNEFEAEIKELGVFSEKYIRIIWLSINNCEKLQIKIDEILSDIFPKEKRFMSHLTIARIKKIPNRKKFLNEIKKIKIHNLKFIVNNFKLKKSILTEKKPIYEDIKIYYAMENIK
jgi:RNA 2',3'-cyclic 3'-phosphodiesterase